MTQTNAKTRVGSACTWLMAAALLVPGAALAGDKDRDKGKGKDRSDCRLKMVGLTSNHTLVGLRACDSPYIRSVRGITGLTGADTVLVGIDYRVQDGELYGVGNAGGIYLIDTDSGKASKTRQLTVALQGTSFGVDFNPAADALRIVSDSGQNLRHPFADPAAATVVDGALNYTAGTTATGIGGAAYINNDLSADTGTLLFNIDTTLNQLALQVPPNAGGLTRIGALGIDPAAMVGFDVYSTVERGVAVENKAFTTISAGGTTRLYEVDLLTGAADWMGNVRESVVDLAIPIYQ